jgi:predicted nucleic acid-binding protein
MSVKYFLDTNVLVYSFDDKAPAKRDRARDLIAKALREGSGVISWQVVQEFLNVALHKWEKPMSPGDASEYLSGTLEPLCTVFPSTTLWRSALSIHATSQYRFYDSMIVASAQQSGAGILYSEDLQAGRQFGHLRILNPFT